MKNSLGQGKGKYDGLLPPIKKKRWGGIKSKEGIEHSSSRRSGSLALGIVGKRGGKGTGGEGNQKRKGIANTVTANRKKGSPLLVYKNPNSKKARKKIQAGESLRRGKKSYGLRDKKKTRVHPFVGKTNRKTNCQVAGKKLVKPSRGKHWGYADA